MPQKRIRDFQTLIQRLRSSLNPVGNLLIPTDTTAWGEVFPLTQIILGAGNPRRVLISGGIHGDEPSGVEAICRFLEDKVYKEFISDWEITLLPCINPTGFELGTRENHKGIDLNREFKFDTPAQEVNFVKNVLTLPYDLDLELHEDVDSPGYYLYHKRQRGQTSELGRQVLNSVSSVMSLNMAPEIEGMPAHQGLLDRLSEPESMEWWPMALYAYSKGCKEVFTMETSPQFPMEKRVQAHITGIRAALENFEKDGL